MKLIVRGADYAMTDSITDGCLRAARCYHRSRCSRGCRRSTDLRCHHEVCR